MWLQTLLKNRFKKDVMKYFRAYTSIKLKVDDQTDLKKRLCGIAYALNLRKADGLVDDRSRRLISNAAFNITLEAILNFCMGWMPAVLFEKLTIYFENLTLSLRLLSRFLSSACYSIHWPMSHHRWYNFKDPSANIDDDQASNIQYKCILIIVLWLDSPAWTKN